MQVGGADVPVERREVAGGLGHLRAEVEQIMSGWNATYLMARR
ncbi:hypothetical protein [Micromonospora sp. NPDC049497]